MKKMKFQYLQFVLLTFCIGLFNSCLVAEYKDVIPECEIQANGLTRAINDLVPENILSEMKRLGIPIYGGGNPPNFVEGVKYKASPLIFVASNISTDFAGKLFLDEIITLKEQDKKALTIKVDYTTIVSQGLGIGSFVVGDNNQFTIFSKIDITDTRQIQGITGKFVEVFSGTITPTGIKDLHQALFMIDDMGDPNKIWIENGQGRVVKDQDGFSERL
jgi:hypothetical protein